MLMSNYNLASLIRMAIGSALNSENEFKTLEELYPSLFGQVEVNNNSKAEEIYWDRFSKLANKQFEEKNKN